MTTAISWVFLLAGLLPQAPTAAPPPIDSQVTFLYYADLDAAARFYADYTVEFFPMAQLTGHGRYSRT